MKQHFIKYAGCLAAAAVLTGALGTLPVHADTQFGWEIVDGNWYWYEDGKKQGTEGRGKEIYDPASDAWYWLDAVDGGRKAVSKDVYQESAAGAWAERPDGTGKWVRYDSEGHMIKGWSSNENGTYYFDLIFGTMAKGNVTIDGRQYEFDRITGILRGKNPDAAVPTPAPTPKPTPAPTPTPDGNFTYHPGDVYYKYEYAYRTGDTSGLPASDMRLYSGLKNCLDTAAGYSTPYEKELAVHDWLVLHCAYDYENYRNNTVPMRSYHPEGLFVYGKAVCQGYTESFKLCMDILGIPCETVTGTANGGGHAWNAVCLDNEWYMVDVTWDDPVPDTPGSVKHTYFNVTDQKLKRDHTYHSTIAANGTKYYYYADVENYFTDAETDEYYAYIVNALRNVKSGETVSAVVELNNGSTFYDANVINQYKDFSRVNGLASGWSCNYSDYMATFRWTRR